MSCKHGNWEPFQNCEQEEKNIEEAIKNERKRIAAWLDSDWEGDSCVERYHRAWIAAKLLLI